MVSKSARRIVLIGKSMEGMLKSDYYISQNIMLFDIVARKFHFLVILQR